MKSLGDRKSSIAILIQGIFFLLLFLGADSGWAEDIQPPTIAGVSREEALRLGEKMYRQGILPSGEPTQAFVSGDIPIAGTAFSCMSCHLRSGLGSFEGRVVTPPTSGKKLSQPFKTILYNDFYRKTSETILYRPAYTDGTLVDAIRGGVDPTGRVLDDVMPRYLLEDKDMAVLIFYLKSLSSQFSPGVSATTLRFATVVSEDVSPESRDEMLVPLANYIAKWNKGANAKKTQESMDRIAAESAVASMRFAGPELAYRTLSLFRWVLKGPPETWRSQLEEYNRKEPIFALIGGITTGEWKPIHDFCEKNQIPSLFPITDFPVISESDWYTFYLSKGYYQEGEGAARYLNSMGEQINGGAIVQIARDSHEGRALSEGFQTTWLDLGHKAPVTVMLRAGETLTEDFLKKVLANERPASVVLWDGPEALPALETLAGRNRPEKVFVSEGYLGKSVWTLKEQVRDFTYITYPFRLPRKVKGNARMTPQPTPPVIQEKTYAITQVLSRALMDMRGNYYRDYFFDVIGMMEDQEVAPYERLSFGPGQRYASKGCYIVQFTKGPSPELIKKSDWVIH